MMNTMLSHDALHLVKRITVISGELAVNVTVYCLDRAVLLLAAARRQRTREGNNWYAYGNVPLGTENALWRPVCPLDSKGLT
jgi:hypothetical protein